MLTAPVTPAYQLFHPFIVKTLRKICTQLPWQKYQLPAQAVCVLPAQAVPEILVGGACSSHVLQRKVYPVRTHDACSREAVQRLLPPLRVCVHPQIQTSSPMRSGCILAVQLVWSVPPDIEKRHQLLSCRTPLLIE